MEHHQHESLLGRQAQRSQGVGAFACGQCGQSVQPGGADHMDAFGRFAHANQPFARGFGGHQMVAAELADGVAHRFVDRARSLTAVDMQAGDAQMQSGNRAGEHLAAVAQEQQQVGLLSRQRRGDAAQTFRDAQRHALTGAGYHVQRDLAADRQVGRADLVHRVSMGAAQVHAGDQYLQ